MLKYQIEILLALQIQKIKCKMLLQPLKLSCVGFFSCALSAMLSPLAVGSHLVKHVDDTGQ